MLNLQNIKDAKAKINGYDPLTFSNAENSYVKFVNKIEIEEFRHIKKLNLSFDHPITVITGTNKIGNVGSPKNSTN